MLPLTELLETQFFPIRTQIAKEHTRERYCRAVVWLGETLGRPALVSDLSDDHLAALTTHLRSVRNQCPRTINGSLDCLRALWRWCQSRGMIQTGPTLAPLKVASLAPRAWNESEVLRLVQAAACAPGSICGLPARQWWLTLLALEMDTGARAGELLAMRYEWIDWDRGTITVPPEVRKGAMVYACYGLRRDTLAWLKQMSEPQGLILRWEKDVSRYYQLWKELLARAGLPSTRYTKTHCLRRTFATLLELNGGNATLALGHASRATTLRHYLDPSAVAQCHADRIPFHPLRVSGE